MSEKNPYSLTPKQLKAVNKEKPKYWWISFEGGKRSVFVPDKFIRVTTTYSVSTPNIECYSMNPDSEVGDQFEETMVDFCDKWMNYDISNWLQTTLLIFLGRDIESKNFQYFICKQFSTFMAKKTCIRHMKQRFCQPIEISCPMMVNAFEDISWIKVMYESCKSSYKSFRIVIKTIIEKQFSVVDEPTEESPMEASMVCPEESPMEDSVVCPEKETLEVSIACPEKETLEVSIANSSIEFSRLVRELSHSCPENKTSNEKVKTARSRKPFICCGSKSI